MGFDKVAVIGAGGKMGKWFTDHFAKKFDVPVSIYDVSEKSLVGSGRVRVAGDITSCVKDADMVFVCVPVQKTVEVVKKCALAMKNGAVIVEISSVKARTFNAMRKIPAKINPLCIHPMFGPGAGHDNGLKILLVPVRDREKELWHLKEIFQESQLNIKVIDSPKEHDRAIAMILGLTYFANVAFAKMLAKENLPMLKEMSGTTFSLQLLLSESIFTDEPDLIVALIAENPQVAKYIIKYVAEANELAKLVGSSEVKKSALRKSIRRTKVDLKEQEDLDRSYRSMYRLIDELKRSA